VSTRLGEYVLGNSQHEYNRLVRQAAFLKPMTRRVFQEAGIQSGMRVLDLGSGSGDVCMLLAEMVGPTGCVIGLEQDAGAVHFAETRTAVARHRNIMFVHSEFSLYVPEAPLDAIVGRSVLLYQPDPVAAIAAVTKHLRPGGIVAFLEPWLAVPQGPANPALRVLTCIVETMRRSGAHIDLGPRLHKVFASAGLPRPTMRFEAVMDAQDESPLYELIADSFVSLLPKAIEYGLVTPEEIDVESIPALLRATMNAAGYAAMSLPTVSAWCRTATA
jgi:SAM-dependent methyltransferase